MRIITFTLNKRNTVLSMKQQEITDVSEYGNYNRPLRVEQTVRQYDFQRCKLTI
jgi:hypothetical protein